MTASRPPVSAKAVVRVGDAVLLGENDRGEWELLGGGPEPGETAAEAVAREVLEEAALRVEVGAGVLDEPFEVVPGRVVRVVAFRCVPGDESARPRASQEHRRVAFLPVVALDALVLPDVHRRAIAAADAEGNAQSAGG